MHSASSKLNHQDKLRDRDKGKEKIKPGEPGDHMPYHDYIDNNQEADDELDTLEEGQVDSQEYIKFCNVLEKVSSFVTDHADDNHETTSKNKPLIIDTLKAFSNDMSSIIHTSNEKLTNITEPKKLLFSIMATHFIEPTISQLDWEVKLLLTRCFSYQEIIKLLQTDALEQKQKAAFNAVFHPTEQWVNKEDSFIHAQNSSRGKPTFKHSFFTKIPKDPASNIAATHERHKIQLLFKQHGYKACKRQEEIMLAWIKNQASQSQKKSLLLDTGLDEDCFKALIGDPKGSIRHKLLSLSMISELNMPDELINQLLGLLGQDFLLRDAAHKTFKTLGPTLSHQFIKPLIGLLHHEDSCICRDAIQTLANLNLVLSDTQQIALIISLIKRIKCLTSLIHHENSDHIGDAINRIETLKTLGTMPSHIVPNELIKFLLELLHHENSIICRTVISTLGTLYAKLSHIPDEFIKPLIDLLHHEDLSICRCAIYTLGTLSTKHSTVADKFIKPLIGLLHHEDLHVCRSAIHTLGNLDAKLIHNPDEFIKPLIGLLHHKDLYVCTDTIKTLGTLATKHPTVANELIKPLIGLLHHKDLYVCTNTIETLGALGAIYPSVSDKLIKSLIGLLYHEDLHVCRNAIKTFEALGTKLSQVPDELFNKLTALSRNDKDWMIQLNSCRALWFLAAALSKPQWTTLIKLFTDKLTDTSYPVCFTAGQFLANQSETLSKSELANVIKTLIHVLNDKHYNHPQREAAYKTLGALDTTLPGLQRTIFVELIINSLSNEEPATEEKLETLGILGAKLLHVPDKLINLLTDLFCSKDPRIELEACKSFGAIGAKLVYVPDKVINQLIDWVNSQDSYKRKAACQTLNSLVFRLSDEQLAKVIDSIDPDDNPTYELFMTKIFFSNIQSFNKQQTEQKLSRLSPKLS